MIHLYRTASPLGQTAAYRIPPIEIANPAIRWDELLAAKLAEQTTYVEPYSVPGWQGRVWLKRARPKRSALMYLALNALASAMRMPWLKASPSAAGGRESTAVELRRLQALQQAGVRVPKVLAHTDNAILMQDVAVGLERSESLQHMIETHFANRELQTALAYWQQGLQALLALHRKDQYLSQAFSRNMVLDADGELGFVDFEDDPLEVMSLLDCKVRDVFCYLHSTAWPIAQAGAVPQAQEFLAQWILQYEPAEQKAFQAAARRARFARRFPKDRRFGRDAVLIHYLHALLSAIEA